MHLRHLTGGDRRQSHRPQCGGKDAHAHGWPAASAIRLPPPLQVARATASAAYPASVLAAIRPGCVFAGSGWACGPRRKTSMNALVVDHPQRWPTVVTGSPSAAAAGVIVAGLAVNAASGRPRALAAVPPHRRQRGSGRAGRAGPVGRRCHAGDRGPAARGERAERHRRQDRHAGRSGRRTPGDRPVRRHRPFATDAASYLFCALVAARMRPLRPCGGGRCAGLGSFAVTQPRQAR
jgi:hypothetical protein